MEKWAPPNLKSHFSVRIFIVSYCPEYLIVSGAFSCVRAKVWVWAGQADWCLLLEPLLHFPWLFMSVTLSSLLLELSCDPDAFCHGLPSLRFTSAVCRLWLNVIMTNIPQLLYGWNVSHQTRPWAPQLPLSFTLLQPLRDRARRWSSAGSMKDVGTQVCVMLCCVMFGD